MRRILAIAGQTMTAAVRFRLVVAVVLICIVVGSAIWTNDNFTRTRQPDTNLVQCVGTVRARELAEISGIDLGAATRETEKVSLQ